MAYNFHYNAAALILAAAKLSGLLDHVAEALCFTTKTVVRNRIATACELLSGWSHCARTIMRIGSGQSSAACL